MVPFLIQPTNYQNRENMIKKKLKTSWHKQRRYQGDLETALFGILVKFHMYVHPFKELINTNENERMKMIMPLYI